MLGLAIILLCIGGHSQDIRLNLDPDLLTEIASYLEGHNQSPEDYVLSKFETHDIVFLGERHRLKHDVALVRNLIPRLYDHGIYNLGIEFADFADQAEIDRLINTGTYDESLARRIQFDWWPFWGYQGYIDIYKAAWELNRTLPSEARRFRVIGLNADADWSHVWTEKGRKDPEVMKKVLPHGDVDPFMANTILREFVDKGEKALIYSGCNHAYTRYHQPIYNVEKDSLVRLNSLRMGNLVYDSIGDRCFNISLHSPWPAASSFSRAVLAADGYIDSLIAILPPGKRRAGFDVIGTPFERLPGSTSYWKHGYDDFQMRMYCDGYIIQMALKDYRGVSVADGFINESNRLAAISQSANPRTKDSSRTVESLVSSMRRDTEIQRIFQRLIDGY
jgi:hypothetical protein